MSSTLTGRFLKSVKYNYRMWVNSYAEHKQINNPINLNTSRDEDPLLDLL